ncbi:hypothetical protein BDP_1675 [Bifidobacterium dentium Bd1]|nr:hypothetical protein BDP_1675 [Bifidobacterium dentium Bd1]
MLLSLKLVVISSYFAGNFKDFDCRERHFFVVNDNGCVQSR